MGGEEEEKEKKSNPLSKLMLLSLLRSEAEDVPASPAVADVTVSEAGYVEAGSPRASQQTSPVRFEKPPFCRQQSWLAFQKTRFFSPCSQKEDFFSFLCVTGTDTLLITKD